jgi:hypothetical protein
VNGCNANGVAGRIAVRVKFDLARKMRAPAEGFESCVHEREFILLNDSAKALLSLYRSPQKCKSIFAVSERLDIDPSGARCGCFLPDLTRLARHLPAPTPQSLI